MSQFWSYIYYSSDFVCTLVVKLMCDGQPSSDVLLLRTDTAFRCKRNIHLSLEPLGRAEGEREGEGERQLIMEVYKFASL